MSNYSGIEVAVVGMACRFPQANSIDDYWSNLKNGIESIIRLTEEDILEEGELKGLLENPAYVKANAFVEDKQYFDADFFAYRPAEAKLMDPQLRIFHELCWSALEDAGYGLRNDENTIGVFAGASTNLNWENYAVIANRENIVDDYTAAQLRNTTYLCSRVSYLLNLQGPTMYLNTACSTSMVAIQRACMSLLLRECDMALAGGVTIKNYSQKGYLFEEGMINSPDGHCRAFDAEANGTVGGEGAGVVVLKRMEDALEAGDHIYAIVRGTAVNNDGNDKSSFTAPSILGQYKTILKALNMANVPAQSIGYVEAHGTATNLGDPIEVEALNLAFGKGATPYCGLGSVKTNIGHLDVAAGVAGFIKTVLALKNRQIPPSLNFDKPNPKINFEDSPFYINTQLKEWKNDEYPLRAGLSSFGIGGTNAHAILEEAPPARTTTKSSEYQLFLLSGKTRAALNRNVENLKKFLKKNEEIDLADAAYTLQVGRTPFKYRKAIVCKNKAEAIECLSSENENHRLLPAFEKGNKSVVFLFSGQGVQYVNMCRDLYQKENIFRKEVDHCLEIVERQSGIKLLPVLFADTSLGRDDKINQTEYTQPLLFIVEYALTRLLMHWGIRPDIMIGHSIGEYVAACISGVFTLEDALLLVVKRGALMQKMASGLMLSISISESELNSFLDKHSMVSLAAVNSSELCVVSGTAENIQDFKKEIQKAGYQNKIIRTSHAFHSYMMDEILEAFVEEVRKVNIQKQEIPFISNVSGDYAKDDLITQPAYWASHLRQAVLFSKGLEKILEEKNGLFIEVGPGKTLSTFVRSNRLREKNKHRVVSLIRHPKEEVDDRHRLLTGLGELWTNGLVPNWSAFYGKELRNRLSLPGYSFEKQEFPVLVDSYQMISEMIAENSVEKNPDISKWLYTPSWRLSAPIGEKPSEKQKINIIFSDDSGIGDTLIEKFKASGEEVICVKIGKEFKEISTTSYTLNPHHSECYRDLFSNLTQHQLTPDRIIHAWAISPETKADFGEQSYDICCYSLYEIIRQFQDHWTFSDKELLVLSNEVHPIDKPATRPLVASSLGLLKVVSQEYSDIYTGHIDISLSEKEEPSFFDLLYREILDQQKGKVISLRRSCRWEQHYVPVRKKQKGTGQKLRKKGVYLITGGLGDLGYQLALHLLDKLEATVILTGRSTILSDKKKQKLEGLEKRRGQVLYRACDITDKAAFSETVKEMETKFGNLNGVVHAAGIVNGDSINLISQLRKEDFLNQNASKIAGLIVLKEVLENKPLDFCVLSSSLSAILGGIRFAAYASANIFMDYYIKSCKKEGALNNWISANFDGLNFSNTATREINAEELFELFELLLLHSDLPQIAISTSDLNKALDLWVYQTEKIRTPENQRENLENDSILPSEATSLSDMENALLKIWKDFFGKSEMDIDDDFFDIGGDSLKALTIIGRINGMLKTNLSVTDFFKWPSIKKLSAGILRPEGGNSTLPNQNLAIENQEEFIF